MQVDTTRSHHPPEKVQPIQYLIGLVRVRRSAVCDSIGVEKEEKRRKGKKEREREREQERRREREIDRERGERERVRKREG